ncbi:DNA-protecting protein DprA [Rahnella bonaserana]|uniref:DNA-protecting protein DprA n=1 Tax=Rahnella bonaserana TaxID=2816248 RepID=A0ABS6LNR4_9GAMM|nr:DNA-protecting protein DprA [Rahnella bonaserana]MBU9853753.1 DNA-protecting protein DprA [Rahnella bonaserana]
MTLQEVWIRLSRVKRLDAGLAQGIIQSLFNSGIYSPAALAGCGLSEEQIANFRHCNAQWVAESLRWLESDHRHLIHFGSTLYSALLAQISSPPLILFVEGDPDLLTSPQIAMVGSREFTHYGEQYAQVFASGLVSSGFTVTSGLAMGIDGISHRATLEAQGKTIAVLGSGLLKRYPPRHSRLAQHILEAGGALVSEHLVTAPPLAAHFPRRNRIISGLSAGVLVIEATLRSGSLITARYALEQGREVFALPGPLGRVTSEGTHWLIQQGAYLVTEPNDIAEHIGSGLTWFPDIRASESFKKPANKCSVASETIICAQDSEVELPFADVLANVEYEVTSVDVVAERAGQPVPEVVGKLLELELAGWIAAVSGGYVRIKRASHVRRTNVLI